ncbi:MAG: RNA methyltransferase [Gordonibacter sp.]|nr:RNA methyltransferase [Gordonibacter sp.]
MPLIHIASLDDPRLSVYSGVTDAQLRDCSDFEQGLFIAESRKVIDRARTAGMRLCSLFLEEKWLTQTMPLIECVLEEDPTLPVLVATRTQFHAITGYEVTRGALAAFERPALPEVTELLADSHRVAILEDVTNYTNIGAVFRSAAALGIDAVLITPSCHDPLYRRAARVSMGTVFQVPWTRIGEERDWALQGVPLLHELGFKTAALALSDNAVPLHDARLRECDKLALVLGTEGDGLSVSTIAQCDYTVKIPMDHDVDSLNVAAASAVAFWELRTKWRD